MQPGYPGQDPDGQQPQNPTPQPPPYGQQPPSQDPYGQQPYPSAPAYPGGAAVPPATGQSNIQGLLAMIFGIASLPFAFCCLGIPLGIAAVILGFMGKKKAEQGLASNRGQALAGLICGAIGIGLTVIFTIVRVAANSGSITGT